MEDSQKEQNLAKFTFEEEINKFINHLDAQYSIMPLIMQLLAVKLIQESKHVSKFINDYGVKDEEKKEDEESDTIGIPSEKINEFIKLNKTVQTTSLAHDLLPINFIVSFVSQYDAYLGGLIKTMFYSKNELLNTTEKNILLSEILKFKSIEEAQEYIIEKEVESVLRESHIKQFKWLENKLGITLRKDLSSFADFVEITERRNLFVHTNGIVSRQYIEICRENNVKNNDINIGDKLDAKPKYFSHCYSTLYEIGVKLGHVVWRKLLPIENDKADAHLINLCFDLIVNEHYKLALNLLSFATDTLKKHNQENLCTFIINKALTYYLSDKKTECNKILDQHDWSASSDKFKLAITVLKDDYEQAIKIMKTIGNQNNHISKNAYREWPLFKFFRKEDAFKETYKQIFGEELTYIETKPKDLEDIANDLKKLKKEATESKKEDTLDDTDKTSDTNKSK